MNYIRIVLTSFKQNCYIVWCKKTLCAAIIDPGSSSNISNIIDNLLRQYKLLIKIILITHCHLDHIGTAYVLSKKYHIPIIGPHENDIILIKNLKFQAMYFNLPYCIYKDNYWVKHKQNIYLGQILFIVYHCPGHTPGHVIYYNQTTNILISGDILFPNSIGRTDFPYSNYLKLLTSIKQYILSLNSQTLILPGHEKPIYLFKIKKYNQHIIKILKNKNINYI
ncbi:MBL fold metallo-hydrolase [Enterobacteriaceae endosymbiont of Macroplea appendiculata]|uniref:MBL fold metallo-hydrolase n=1 Tax=Enterobacteriaceae endosymbiont of Macroplea appendiculata TaxID=2675790 RepID=UPI00144A0054|nr:MBL fold metallo-hydrolase [Enterobacteriaceae endosymbiont of Macroplea appendiculata]QJC30896.1 MBL fold metallo-hydrolase [Enterobacteriaceae endosymbiont of Macroplea appendiculata]